MKRDSKVSATYRQQKSLSTAAQSQCFSLAPTGDVQE
jgi:hypothetical protein